MIYLGTPGRMVGIKCPASQQVQASDRHGLSTTLEGRVKAQVRPAGRRVWDMSLSDATTPADASVLQLFAQGAWGSGPFAFVSADAPYTNALTPETASCDPSGMSFTQGGPVLLPNGLWAPRSLLGDGVANVLFGIVQSPLPPSGQVSAGAWVQGEGAFTRLNWYDESKVFIGSTASTALSSGGMTWSTVSATPPAGAAGVIVSANKAAKATHPTLLWGSTTPAEWVDGQGCEKAVVHVSSRGLVLTGPGRTYANVSFTVTEVG